jgi:hypothetical protein
MLLSKHLHISKRQENLAAHIVKISRNESKLIMFDYVLKFIYFMHTVELMSNFNQLPGMMVSRSFLKVIY